MFSSSFRGLNESCCVKGTGFGLAAPNATVSGCCLNENLNCCRGSDVDPRKQCGRGQGGSVLFPVAQTVYCGKFLFSEQKLSLLSLCPCGCSFPLIIAFGHWSMPSSYTDSVLVAC